MKFIELTQGKKTIIDDEDFNTLSKFKWSFSNGYAAKKITGNRNLFLHTLVMNPPAGKKVDHINGDSLDNRKSNLRICTQAQNLRNQKIGKRNKSGYKGVSYMKEGKRVKRWVVKIVLNYKQYHVGYFETKQEGAVAYNEAAKKYFGEFANLNKV